MGDGVQQFLTRQYGLITRAQAIEAGLRSKEVDWLLQAKRWQALYQGVYQAAPPSDPLRARILAATLWSRGVASHRTAARLWKMDAFDEFEGIDLTTTFDVRDPRVRLRRVAKLDPAVIGTWKKIPVTGRERTLLDLGDVAPQDDVEAALDWCIRKKATNWSKLEKLLKAHRRCGQKGPATLARVLALRSGQKQHTDSLLETRFLQLSRAAKFPTPILQYPVVSEGQKLATVDFAWPDKKLLVETVGHKDHGVSPWQFDRDAARANMVANLKTWLVLTFTWNQVHHQADWVCFTVARELGLSWGGLQRSA